MTIHPLLKLYQVIGDPEKGIAPLIPVSKSSWYAGIAAGRFPQPVKLGKRAVAWRATDIQALLVKPGSET